MDCPNPPAQSMVPVYVCRHPFSLSLLVHILHDSNDSDILGK